ncbi:GNAT family N-acetyltransferase [Achromobacter sp. SD115]|uniref:Aminoglycoside N(6')-acetyltransferase type 1 n=1 Tax=Achromobacter xylosoxidans (strain A8) TaxID=762376 RepID=E3HNJ0_ACHXA|nr:MULTISPECIES: aminoglycoside 6'-N-acetyltransferase [Achromobacter]ADP15855.1 aminoglycoside 6'-N-acetyltransferase Iz [Achromobacter xylosoxidans A8]MBO1013781.1 GNAT family N-acetyltransferase [Achromobacter sp. SD115]
MKTTAITSSRNAAWLQLRMALWPDASAAEHQQDMDDQVSSPDRYAQFLVSSDGGQALGLAEASIRTDYVNGTDSSPVAFLEGLYVIPEARQRGAARALVAAVREWALDRGCKELASDTALDNLVSQAAHSRLGFKETQRVVYFNMPL